MSKSETFRSVITKMMEAVTLDSKGNLSVINEDSMADADELLGQLVVETAREWWSQLESVEGSLADMSDEISFAELNADPSHAVTPKTNMHQDNNPTLESMLGSKDFDLSSILEMDDEDFGPDDGDDDYDDLMRGDDKNGLGDNSPTDDDFDAGEDGMDSMGDDDIDMDMGDDDMDMDDESDFDFSFLDDESDMDMGDDDMDMDDDESDMDMDDDDMGDDDMDMDDDESDMDMDDDESDMV